MRALAWVLLLACLALPMWAQDRGPVALIPAHTFKGSLENGPVVTEAMRANLSRQGYRVLAEAETAAALKRLGIDPTRRVFLPDLKALGKELGVSYVVYPSIQAVGVGLNRQDPEEFQATILVSVAEPDKNQIFYLYQVGQLFKHPEKEAARAVLPRAAAEQAAQRLLESFYKKAGR